MRKSSKVALTAVAALLVAAPAFAFHDGGVAKCEGCHTMHNSLNGIAMITNGGALSTQQYTAGPFLLKGSDQSSACLNCHESSTLSGYKVSTTGSLVVPTDVTGLSTPKQYTPGGDFRWLKWNDNRGHNIIAADFSYTADSRLAASPGGTYPATSFYCSSCHDPHGKYRYVGSDTAQVTTGGPIVGSSSYTAVAAPAGEALGVYRILGGDAYRPASVDSALAFTNGAPVAIAPSSYNRVESASDTIVGYGSGMSEWCANCHGTIHANAMVNSDYLAGTAATNFSHPASNASKLSFVADIYNSYVTSGVTGAGAYTSLVPFEQGKAALDTTLTTTAPTADALTSNVACISCHRVHASGFSAMLRFDVDNTLITVEDGAGAAVYSTDASTNARATAAYYQRPASTFGAEARVLCNKCHAKD